MDRWVGCPPGQGGGGLVVSRRVRKEVAVPVAWLDLGAKQRGLMGGGSLGW